MQLPAEYEWNIARTRTQRCQPSEVKSSLGGSLQPLAIPAAALGALLLGQPAR